MRHISIMTGSPDEIRAICHHHLNKIDDLQQLASEESQEVQAFFSEAYNVLDDLWRMDDQFEGYKGRMMISNLIKDYYKQGSLLEEKYS